jgi:hypothetical protein
LSNLAPKSAAHLKTTRNLELVSQIPEDQACSALQGLKPGISLRYGVAAEQVSRKCPFEPSGVKTPEGNADFMSCLKARPTKRETFSAICEAATSKAYL